jgi:tripeptide aminopeptidase
LEYSAFYVEEGATVISLAKKVLEGHGINAQVVSGGGGQDGNHFNAHGIAAVGLSTGYENVHTEKEEQSISQLVKCGQVVAGIIQGAGEMK